MQKERIVWVDVMRGFSMLLVVLGHVLMKMGFEDHDTFLTRLLVSFRMPLFFFVSGYFSYRAQSWWTRSGVKDILTRKFKAQIFGTIVFLCIFQYVKGGGIPHGFGGYWFTIVLFQMYLIYLGVNLSSHLIKRSITVPALIVLSLIGVALFIIRPDGGPVWEFLVWPKLVNYFQFFSLGIICAAYKYRFFTLLSSDKFKTVVIIGWVGCMILWYSDAFRNAAPLLFTANFNLAVRYFGLLCVIMVFFAHEATLSDGSRYSKVFRFIGRRTLDIYLLHFFFLPNLNFLRSYISADDFLLQLVVGIIVTIVITALCLLVSQVLRQSSTLRVWLFGERYKQTAKPQSV